MRPSTSGLILGMKSAGWDDVPLVTMETVGADCFNKSLKAGRIVKIDAIRRWARTRGVMIPTLDPDTVYSDIWQFQIRFRIQ